MKQCVQFYYLWKKVCSEEYELLSRIRRQRRNQAPGLCENMQTTELVSDVCRNGKPTSYGIAYSDWDVTIAMGLT